MPEIKISLKFPEDIRYRKYKNHVTRQGEHAFHVTLLFWYVISCAEGGTMDTDDGEASLSEAIPMHSIHTTTSTDEVKVNIASF